MFKFLPNTDNKWLVTETGRVFHRPKVHKHRTKICVGYGPFEECSYHRVHGYLCVSSPYSHGSCKVHRLVAMAFVDNPNPEVFTVIDHIDGNKDNNHSSNLRWCNQKINTLNPNTRPKLFNNRVKPYLYTEIKGINVDTGEETPLFKNLKEAQYWFRSNKGLPLCVSSIIGVINRAPKGVYRFTWTGKKVSGTEYNKIWKVNYGKSLCER